MAKVVKL